jgi:vacuolar-type H+-ATPase subunit E/Vma4
LGLDELLHTLRKNEQQQIEEIWQQARNEADTIRRHVADAIAQVTREHKDLLTAACRKSVSAILAESEKKAREKKLLVCQGLNEILYQTAVKLLPELRRIDYERNFTGLVNELPDIHWEKIVVNPSDIMLAAKFFTENIIHSDKGVSGGLIAVNQGGSIVVNNTFEKRLERKWTYLLPELIQDIEKRYGKLRSAEKA